MDSVTLVSRDQIESAGEFLKRLPADGLITTGALWAQVEGDGKPYLYILTPNVETEGPINANLRLGKTLREYQKGVTDPFRRLDPFALKLIGPSETLAQAITLWYQQYPDATPTVYNGPLPSPSSAIALDGAYIYPAKMFDAPATPTPSA
jgi:hypothetical protein